MVIPDTGNTPELSGLCYESSHLLLEEYVSHCVPL